MTVELEQTSRTRQVAVIADRSDAAGREFFLGAAELAESMSPPWVCHNPHRLRASSVPQLAACDGLLVLAGRADVLAVLEPLHRLPQVRVPWRVVPAGCEVCCDDEAIGRCAGEHLQEQGYRQLALCPLVDQSRQAGWFPGLRAVARQANLPRPLNFANELLHATERFTLTSMENAIGGTTALESLLDDWLRRLPVPCGLLTASDTEARIVALRCQALRLAVPEDIGIVGIGNDELMCSTATPPLSSVDVGARQLGHAAMRLLMNRIQEQHNGKSDPNAAVADRHANDTSANAPSARRTPGEPLRVSPVGVVARRSTSLLAIADPDVHAALQLIHDRSRQITTAQEVYDLLPTSWRTLERRFSAMLGRSVYEEITRVRVTRARQLLADSKLTIDDIARTLGFSYRQSFSRWFREATGQLPTEFRTQSTDPRPATAD